MSSKKVPLLLFIPLLLVLFDCKRVIGTRPEVYRFIDHLNRESVIHSSLIHFSEESEPSAKIFPSKSYPAQDMGIEENPLGIKRKLKIGGAELNVLFAPPRSEYIFIPDIPEKAVLKFGIGIVRDENSKGTLKASEDKKGVNFLVALEKKGRKKTIFQKYLRLPSSGELHILSRHSVSLPYSREDVRLSLVTEGGKGNFSFWYNPVLYSPGEDRRNVILISVDTLRADHLGCYGYKRETSPNIDSLASDSSLFLNTYASSPWTLPSHVSILTSLFGVHHQVYYDDEKMDPSIITLADVLRQNHFFCSAITGGGFVSSVYGFSKGFDSYYEGEGGVFHQDSAERVCRAVEGWLDRNKDRKFFLFIHTYQTHNPYACPYPYKTMFLDERAKWGHINLLGYLGGREGIFKKLPEEERQNIISLYDGEIRYTDEKLIKPLIERLKEMALYDQTMIIFTSDHGEEFYDHQGWEHGHSLYDESLKVPLIIKFPNSRFKGKRFESIVRLVDIMPTILEEMDLEYSGVALDGQSLIPVLKGKEKEDRAFLADIGSNLLNSHIPQKMTMNSQKDKLIISKKFSKKDLKFFLSPPPTIQPVELYDLARDPLEKRNLAEEESSLVNLIIRQINEIYREATKRKSARPEIDEKIKEQLRALGYIR